MQRVQSRPIVTASSVSLVAKTARFTQSICLTKANPSLEWWNLNMLCRRRVQQSICSEATWNSSGSGAAQESVSLFQKQYASNLPTLTHSVCKFPQYDRKEIIRDNKTNSQDSRCLIFPQLLRNRRIRADEQHD